MTSTITAEERATELLGDKQTFVKAGAPHDCERRWSVYEARHALIAAAIRDAEDDAYERAAAIAKAREKIEFDQGEWFAVAEVADAILNLKSPSPPKDQGHE